MSKDFTTGQIAKLCRVAPRTVSKWIQSGLLPGYRLAKSLHNRVTRADLVNFLKQYGMPLGDLEKDEESWVLFVRVEQSVVDRIRQGLAGPEWRFVEVDSAFDAGLAAGRRLPVAMIVDLLYRPEGLALIGAAHREPVFQNVHKIALAYEDEPDEQFLTAVFDEVFRRPFDPRLVAEKIHGFVHKLRRTAGKGLDA